MAKKSARAAKKPTAAAKKAARKSTSAKPKKAKAPAKAVSKATTKPAPKSAVKAAAVKPVPEAKKASVVTAKPAKAPKVKKPAAPKVKADRPLSDDEKKWIDLHERHKSDKSQLYDMRSSFEANKPLQHKILGWGWIMSNDNDRLEVLFQDGKRILISNYNR